MKTSVYKSLLIVLSAWIVFTNLAIAEEVNLSDETTAKELLLNKTLHCQMDEQNYHGPEIIKVIKIQGNKFTGFSDFWCWAKGTRYTGKFKNNTLKWNQEEHTGCYCRSGLLKFFKDNDGNLKAEGKYNVGCGSSPFDGTIKCVVLDI